MSDKIANRLKELGIELPEAMAPIGSYVAHYTAGDMLFISGQISKTADGRILSGKLGADLAVADGQAAARACALNILAQAHAALGSLDRIVRVARLNGFVNSTPDFTDQPQVINGASDLIAEVLGDAGVHTRAAIGVASLPVGCAVEIDAIIQIKS